VKLPQGYKFSGVPAGLKPKKSDVALIVSDVPAVCAGAFTVNRAKAAPVLQAEKVLPRSDMRAIIINSGNANALTGPAGMESVDIILTETAKALGVDKSAVVSASTGVIGVRLPHDKILKVLPSLVANLTPEPDRAAEAIMTTDMVKKMATRVISIQDRPVVVSAICKGSGMIAPQLATMIAVVVTDCAIDPPTLKRALLAATHETFDQLTIDQDMSTNDVAFAMANGLAGNTVIKGDGPDYDVFAAALQDLLDELARDIAQDGEGATKRIDVVVKGAPSIASARDVAKSICGSPLVKSAIFGMDPNWGRILATVGARAGSQNYDIDPYKALVSVQGTVVYDGAPIPLDRTILKARMREPEVHILVDLRGGTAQAKAYGCDLSYDYVKINADYTSLIVEKEDGGVAKDDKLQNYSPTFKRGLLVEALAYISRFRGRRCVIKYGGAAMTKESLKRSFCEDVLLLHSVGLLPVVVHGGGPDITRALEKMGSHPEFIDGVRVTPASDVRVVEMVLTGSINTELVTLLNRHGGHAVGVSGKDAALLRAQKLVREDGRDLGQVGELTEVNTGFLESLLSQGYIPIISPVGLGADGQSYNLNADVVAAGVAQALSADKLIYLSDVTGIVEKDELVSELGPAALRAMITNGVVTGGMAIKAESILKALSGGVRAVHLIDGRTPHNVIAELFTDTGVGTIVRAEA
jgi:acetylglutamate kinase